MRKIRVAHCIETIYSGGVEQTRLSFARGLDPARFEQIVICTQALGALPAEFEAAGCKVFPVGTFKRKIDWSVIRRATAVLRDFRPHIVHGGVFEGVAMAAFAGRLAGVPIVIAEETIVPVARRWTGHLYFRLLTGIADEVIAISKGVEDYLTRTIKLPRSKIRLIYNGVAEPEPASAEELQTVRESLGVDSDTPLLGTVGRLDAARGQPDSHKRISDAIASMKLVLEEVPDARLVIVGEGPGRPFLESRARAAGVRGAVIFAGYQARVRPFHEAMQVVLHPAEAEGLPLAPVEAMFAARPVIATDVPGTNEVVVDGETGYLVPLGQPPALARRAIELLGNSELQRRMGGAGLKRARALFGEARFVREIGAFYEELAAPYIGGPRN